MITKQFARKGWRRLSKREEGVVGEGFILKAGQKRLMGFGGIDGAGAGRAPGGKTLLKAGGQFGCSGKERQRITN